MLVLTVVIILLKSEKPLHLLKYDLCRKNHLTNLGNLNFSVGSARAKSLYNLKSMFSTVWKK